MSLSTGARLGPYEVLSVVGAGGMGEVYRARDTRLDRTVAIKVLPSHLSKSEEIRQRFEREAKTISQLSHPHICALYDVGNQDGVEYLVMEYLEGETLADRLVKGALPVEQTLRYGMEIAGALDKAHRLGIVHRDLKPGNVMLTKSGVKLLDFGLAKAVRSDSESIASQLSALATAGTPLTAEGTILGTVQYMAPEQLEGREADGRTDIFALGAVLYEMATGKKAFSGASQVSLISAILRDDPKPISQSQPAAPATLDRVVRVCMAKDPEERWQSAKDVQNELRWISEGSSAAVPLAVVSGRKLRERLAWSLCGALLLAAAAISWIHFREKKTEARTMRFAVFPPDQTEYALGPAAPNAVLSPDGRSLALVITTPDRKKNLWIRPLDSLVAQKLAGTEDAALPFWSPDSRALGFFANGKLRTVDVHGGPAQTLCDALSGNGGAWSRKGIILFAPSRESALQRVAVAGGVCSPVTTLDRKRRDTAHDFPQFLPDGRHFLYLVLGPPETRGIYITSLDSQESRLLLKTSVRATYAPPGYLLFVREGTLMAQGFDLDRLRLTGEPFRLAEDVAYNSTNGRTTVSASDNGVLAYRTGASGGLVTSELLWFDREGKRIGAGAAEGFYVRPVLSPDEKQIAIERLDSRTGAHDIWLIDESRSIFSRLTFGPSNQSYPLWSPDGNRLLYLSDRDGTGDIYEKAANGAGGEKLVFHSDVRAIWDWSPDGRFLAFLLSEPDTGMDLWILPLFGERKPFSFLKTRFNESQAQFSPDGRWMAYASDETGNSEVYVQAFPPSGAKWQISSSGGRFPRWRRDGKELFYVAHDETLMSVAVQTGAGSDSAFQAGLPHALFRPRYFNIPVYPYTVSGDGRRFLINTPVEGVNSSPVTVVLNWAAGLKK